MLGYCPTNLFDVDICRCLPASFLKPTVEIGILVLQIKGFFFIEFIFFPTVSFFSWPQFFQLGGQQQRTNTSFVLVYKIIFTQPGSGKICWEVLYFVAKCV